MEYGFWQSIREDGTAPGKLLFWELYEVLKISNICADIPREVWERETNSEIPNLLYYLYKSNRNAGLEVDRCNPNRISDALTGEKIENLCAVYLLDKDDDYCKKQAENKGILCLNYSLLKKRKEFLRGNAVMYNKGTRSDEYRKCEKQFFTPCNSLIIIDPYLLPDWSKKRISEGTKQEKYKELISDNLLTILDRIIPSKLDISFHISIFSQPKNNNCGFNDDDIFNYLNTEINTRYDIKNVHLSLYHVFTTGNGKGDFHSRHIMSNCMMVNSEDGFDLFSREGKGYPVCGKWARLEFVWPPLDDNSRKDVDNYYQWIWIAYKNTQNINKCQKCGGDGINRLFDFWKTLSQNK